MIRSHVNTASNTNTNNMEGEDSWGQMSPQGFHFPPRSGGTSSSPSLPHGFGPAHESKTLQTTPASPGPAFNGLLGTGGPGEHTSTMSPAAQSGACAHARANSTTSAGRLLTVRELEHKHQEMMMAFNELQDFYGDCGNGMRARIRTFQSSCCQYLSVNSCLLSLLRAVCQAWRVVSAPSLIRCVSPLHAHSSIPNPSCRDPRAAHRRAEPDQRAHCSGAHGHGHPRPRPPGARG